MNICVLYFCYPVYWAVLLFRKIDDPYKSVQHIYRFIVCCPLLRDFFFSCFFCFFWQVLWVFHGPCFFVCFFFFLGGGYFFLILKKLLIFSDLKTPLQCICEKFMDLKVSDDDINLQYVFIITMCVTLIVTHELKTLKSSSLDLQTEMG